MRDLFTSSSPDRAALDAYGTVTARSSQQHIGTRFGLTMLALASAASMPAYAAGITAATTHVSYEYYQVSGGYRDNNVKNGDGSNVLTIQNLSQPILNVPYITSVANPFNVVSASSSLYSTDGWHAFGAAMVGYTFTVLGASYDLIVPVKYTARLSASVFANNTINETTFSFGLADANLYIASYAAVKTYRSAKCTGSCVGYLPDLSIVDSIDVRGSSPNYVQLSAYTEAGGQGGGTAIVDPYFFIDPYFLNLHPTLTLQFSPFIGNDPTAGAVPEPAAWAMMIVGFGAVGVAARTGRRKSLQRAAGPGI